MFPDGKMGATYLGKVLANILGCGTEIVAKGTSIASLTGALSEEFTGNV